MRYLALAVALVGSLVHVERDARAESPTVAPAEPQDGARSSNPSQAAADDSAVPPRKARRVATGRRLAHGALTIAGGAMYLTSEALVKDRLAPSRCRWCDPTGYDSAIRDAVRWDDTGLAVDASNVTGYVLSPLVGLGLLTFESLRTGKDTGGWIDDMLPVVEAATIAGLVNQTFKFVVGAQRPFVRFGEPSRQPGLDDNVSFYSGHTTLTFAIATSAGVVARLRGYQLEPVIWGTGLALAATTGYLRIAADRHYFTDVAVGAITGTAIGLAVPLLLHRSALAEHPVQVTPTANGVAVSGTF